MPNTRRSPYHAATQAAGATEYMVYNHMYVPLAYGRPPLEDYRAVREAVTLWDVGGERQVQIQGSDAVAFANYLVTRDLSDLSTGRCRRERDPVAHGDAHIALEHDPASGQQG